MQINIFMWILFIVLCEAVGLVGSFSVTQAIPTWYAKLKKPSFSPPNWVFGPVWTILYFLIGISVAMLWEQLPVTSLAFLLFVMQLFLNGIWTPVFFGLKNIESAFYIIVTLWIFTLLTIIACWTVSLAAAVLLLPYFAWISFAALLNFKIWQLNKKSWFPFHF